MKGKKGEIGEGMRVRRGKVDFGRGAERKGRCDVCLEGYTGRERV